MELLADLTTGALRFRPGPITGRPTCTLDLAHAAARTLLLGTGAQRTSLFEDGGLRLDPQR
ncbi:hypothetical protein [Streptomyces caeruleatus]|uniref:Uncharacterized protein n=1 Tax=Streptomyces caeruleatus TaxID=661399 RepID=A0A101TFB1_9ACTN|nr:hypothetical protein [Streptomyces caeruleatus]KUN91383.1 hypothetical protein AQJ67_42190 [Streptomyces caeruleatus]